MMLLLLLLGSSPFTSANGHVDQGNRLFAEGKLEDALGEYDKAARALPNDAGVRFNRGAALYGLGRYDEAQKEFLRATEVKDPQLKESAFYNMGNSFFKLQRYKEAVDAYKRALGTDPRDVKAKWNLELALRKLQEEEQKKKQQQNNKDQNQNQDQKDQQDQQQQAQNQQKEKQQKPDPVPQPKDKQEQEQKQQQVEAPKDKPVEKQDAEAVLDALERGEKNLELEQARMRARGRRKPVKDW